MLGALARPSKFASVTWTNWNPLDPRWYASISSGRSDAGINVLPEDAVKIATVFRAINVRAHSVASIPLVVYRRTDDEGKEKAKDHPAYDLLHDKPNAFMTSFRWRHLATVQKILYGNHYSEIYPGRGGIGQLVPLPPTTTRVVDQLADGRLKYLTRDALPRGGYGAERTLIQDELLHLRGFSFDGKSGVPLPNLAKNAMGLALAAEKHGSMFMRRGARFAGTLQADGTMTPETRKQNEEAWQRSWNGVEGTGGTPILTGGLKYQQVAYNHKDSQWLESRTFQVEELLRFIGVPGVLCGYSDKTSTYASAEQFFLSFVTHTVRPETVEFADELNASVITESPQYFADFILEGLLRGDIRTRYTAYQVGIQSGFLSRNEVRVKEDMNKGPEELDVFLEPLNMVEAGNRPDPFADQTAGDAKPASAPDNADNSDETARRAAHLQRRSVERVVRKEIAAIAGATGKLGAAQRFAGNAAGWRGWLTQFYSDHAGLVAADLGISALQATRYCDAQRARFEVGIPTNHEDIEAESVGVLTALLESP